MTIKYDITVLETLLPSHFFIVKGVRHKCTLKSESVQHKIKHCCDYFYKSQADDLLNVKDLPTEP